MSKKNRLPNATFVAAAIAVLCPHCGAEQPSPDNGSDMWEPWQIKEEKRRECVSCDEPFTIIRPSKIALDSCPALDKDKGACVAPLAASGPVCNTAPHPVGCICDDCTVVIGKVHADADAACGREWTCQCGACKRAREIGINRAFAKLEDTERRLESVRQIKAL